MADLQVKMEEALRADNHVDSHMLVEPEDAEYVASICAKVAKEHFGPMISVGDQTTSALRSLRDLLFGSGSEMYRSQADSAIEAWTGTRKDV